MGERNDGEYNSTSGDIYIIVNVIKHIIFINYLYILENSILLNKPSEFHLSFVFHSSSPSMSFPLSIEFLIASCISLNT